MPRTPPSPTSDAAFDEPWVSLFSASVTGTDYTQGTDDDRPAPRPRVPITASPETWSIELSGNTGSQVLQFESGPTDADARRREPRHGRHRRGGHAGHGRRRQQALLLASDYGTDQFVDINIVSDAGTFETALGGTTRDTGSDVVATVNGVLAILPRQHPPAQHRDPEHGDER